MGADIRVYDISCSSCRVMYKGTEYGVWKDPYSWEINVVAPGGKYVGWSLARVASFDDHNLQEAFATQSFIDTFVSNMLFEDFKYLGCERIFARKGDEFCTGEVYQKLYCKQGVYYKDGRYYYVKTNSGGGVSECLTFNSDKDMESVLKNKLKSDISKPFENIGKPFENITKPFENVNIPKVDKKAAEEKLEKAGKQVLKTGAKVAAKGLLAGAFVIGTAAAGTLYIHEKLHKK